MNNSVTTLMWEFARVPFEQNAEDGWYGWFSTVKLETWALGIHWGNAHIADETSLRTMARSLSELGHTVTPPVGTALP